MTVLEAIQEALNMLNVVEVKGERNIVAMSRAMSDLRSVRDTLERLKEDSHDGHDEQGKDVHD